MTHIFVDPDSDTYYATCGMGKCRVFVELSASKVTEDYLKLNDSFSDFDELSANEKERYTQLRQEYLDSDNLEYWKKRIKNWDAKFTCIGKIPDDLTC